MCFVRLLLCVLHLQVFYQLLPVVAAMQVAEFAAKRYVQRALRRCQQTNSVDVTPVDVISFFYGVDAESEEGQQQLQTGETLQPMANLWFGGGKTYDDLCRPFATTVRQAGQGSLVETSGNPQWDITIDGITAQMILCDQFARNIFRGTSEAFAYDEVSLKHARTLAELAVASPRGEEPEEDAVPPPPPSLQGTVYPPYLASIVIALMHSEHQADHARAMSVLDNAKTATPQSLMSWWDNQMEFEREHKRVIDRFGRYPHRNRAHGRTSTPEERDWLEDVDNLPRWAKSQ